MSLQNTVDQTSNETRESWYGTLERLKNQIAWIEYVPEHELMPSESRQLCRACERLIPIIQKLNHKYVD